MTDREMQEKIEQYIQGELTSYEEDELWVEFLKDSSWYEYFDTRLHIVAIGRGRERRTNYSLKKNDI